MFTVKRRLAALLLVSSCLGTAFAQDLAPELDCNARWLQRDDQVYCEIRELTMQAADLLSVNGGAAGGVHISGWDGAEVRVRAQVIAWARDTEAAREAVEQVVIRTDGVLRAERPGQGRGSWAVNYEIRAPRGTDIRVEATNGAISVADIAGDLDLETTNGRIALADVAGTLSAESTNGAIEVTLAGRSFDGESIDLEATNGAVTLRVPEAFSAALDARSVNGGIHVDFPIDVEGRARNWLEAALGSGGPPVRVRTTNGAVRITH
jgi:hypothetical protein